MFYLLLSLTSLHVIMEAAERNSFSYKWCGVSKRALQSYVPGAPSFTRVIPAREECLARSDCMGITVEAGNPTRYTLMKDWQIRKNENDWTSFVPCDGFLSCDRIAFKSTVTGKFLHVDPYNGKITSSSSNYGDNERFVFDEWGFRSGFLYASDRKKYLNIGERGNFYWKKNDIHTKWPKYKEAKAANGFFTLHQDMDRVAIRNHFGKYISTASDGSVTANSGQLTENDWYEAYPRNCLEIEECSCPESIDGSSYTLIRTEFDRDSGSVKAYRPEVIGYQYIDNEDSTSEQSITFSVAEEVTETSSFTHTAGVSVTAGTEFKSGIPSLAEGKISLEVTVSYEFSYATERSVTKSVQADYNCVAAPGTSVRCKALLYKYRMKVPFTQVWQHKRVPECTCESKGVYDELSSHEMRFSVDAY